MKLRILALLFYSLSIASCNKTSNNQLSIHSTPAKIDTARISLIKYDPKRIDCKRVFLSGKSASLNKSDLEKIEIAIDEIISKQNLQQKILFEQSSVDYPKENYKLEDFSIQKEKYVRRYLVIFNEKGEKEIFVAMMCDEIALDTNMNWRGNVNQGHGGGSCLFSFKLNFKSNKYYDIYFNAEA